MLNTSMLSYEFMREAFIVGICISLCASLLGVSMVLKKHSMIGDGLSHVGFASVAIGAAIGWAPLAFAIPVVMVSSFFILKLSERSKIHGDSAIALIASSSLAIGYIVIHSSGANFDVETYLYGSILGINKAELIISVILSLVVILLFALSYNRIFSLTFDEQFSRSTGIKTGVYNALISALCSITVVLGMKTMGALLISSLIIFPTISARQIFKTYKSVVISSACISVVSFIIGLCISYYVDTPVGSMIVVVNLAVLISLMIIEKIFKR